MLPGNIWSQLQCGIVPKLAALMEPQEWNNSLEVDSGGRLKLRSLRFLGKLAIVTKNDKESKGHRRPIRNEALNISERLLQVPRRRLEAVQLLSGSQQPARRCLPILPRSKLRAGHLHAKLTKPLFYGQLTAASKAPGPSIPILPGKHSLQKYPFKNPFHAPGN